MKAAFNEYSQGGEDGIIEEIMKRLGIATGWFVEFGACDGVSLSNTRRLLLAGWQGGYLECDEKKFAALLKSVGGHAARALQARVCASVTR